MAVRKATENVTHLIFGWVKRPTDPCLEQRTQSHYYQPATATAAIIMTTGEKEKERTGLERRIEEYRVIELTMEVCSLFSSDLKFHTDSVSGLASTK